MNFIATHQRWDSATAIPKKWMAVLHRFCQVAQRSVRGVMTSRPFKPWRQQGRLHVDPRLQKRTSGFSCLILVAIFQLPGALSDGHIVHLAIPVEAKPKSSVEVLRLRAQESRVQVAEIPRQTLLCSRCLGGSVQFLLLRSTNRGNWHAFTQYLGYVTAAAPTYSHAQLGVFQGTVSDETVHNVPSMDIQNDQGVDLPRHHNAPGMLTRTWFWIVHFIKSPVI